MRLAMNAKLKNIGEDTPEMKVSRCALLCAVAVIMSGTAASASRMYNAIENKPYILGELATMASRCGVRDKVWAVRLLYTVKNAIKQLDWSVIGPKTNATADDLDDRITQGMNNALWKLANQTNACNGIDKDELLPEADAIADHKKPVFDPEDLP